MESPHCLVRGSLNNDDYFHVKHIVHPGETISSTQHERRAGGKGANQAVTIAKAGGTVDIIGAVGEDGAWLITYLAGYGVVTDGISIVEQPTGRAIIQLAEDGENSIILFPGANHFALPSPLSLHKRTTHLLLQNEIPLSTTITYLHLAKDASLSHPVVTIFNPSPLPSPAELKQIPWKCLDWLIVNKGEAMAMLSSFCSDKEQMLTMSSIVDVLSRLSSHPSFSPSTNIICTLGSEGVCALFVSGEKKKRVQHFIRLPAAKLHGPVVDTTGAGDCFTGYFVQGLMQALSRGSGEPFEQELECILHTCVEASGLCVQKYGTIESIPTRAEVDAKLAEQP